MPHNPTYEYLNLSWIHALSHPTNSLPHSLNNNNNNNQYYNTCFNYSRQKIFTVTIEFNMEQYILKSRTNVVINELVQEGHSQQILLSQQTDYDGLSQRKDGGFGGMGSDLADM